MSDLERRYRRLLWAYPTEYRRDRGAEIIGTYLDLAGPDRRWPSPADAADLLRGGLRQRLRAADAPDLVPGLRLAAVLAFLTATALAGALATTELHPPPAQWYPTFGPFTSLGILAWLAWLLAAGVTAVAPSRWSRTAVAVALAVTMAVIPVSALTGLPRPSLTVLLAQLGLGTLALALPDRLPRPVRLGPPLIAVGAVVVATNTVPSGFTHWTYHDTVAGQLLPGAATALLLTVLLLGTGLAIRGDYRGGWAALILLTPIGLLSLHTLAGIADALRSGAPNPGWSALAGAAVVTSLLGPAVLPVALAVRRRWRRADRRAADVVEPVVPHQCPTCGR